MKKNLKIAGVSALAVLGLAALAACDGNKPESTTANADPVKANGEINVSINYGSGAKKSGVSYQGTSARELSYAGITLTHGTPLPTWTCFAEKLSAQSGNTVKINDVCDYSRADYKKDFEYFEQSGYSVGDKNVDLIMGDNSWFNKACNNNHLVAVSDYLDRMPNLKTWVKGHEDIWNSMKYTNGKVYFTPYFDGLDSIEKMQQFNVAHIEKLLDSENATYDTAKTITKSYEPTVAETTDQKIAVSVNGQKKTITAKLTAANNAVKKQNDLTTKNGQTLVAALKEALIAEYGSAIAQSAGGSATGDAVVYNKLSEIFTGEKACYNTDDLVALLRCVKTNPVLLTGKDQDMNPIVPRTAENKRSIDLTALIAWWGAKGPDSENGKLYFGNDGILYDGRTQDATYKGLDNLHKLYEEGLFVQNFTSDPSGKGLGKAEWRGKCIADGTGFMLYDYNGTSSVFNKDAGRADNQGYNVQPVLPPVVKWSADHDLKFKGENLKGTYFHYSESDRALKSGGWAIPTTSKNIDSALALMDYIFSEEGARIQDFGPDNGKYWTLASADTATDPKIKEICEVNGGVSPIINEAILTDVKTNKENLGWNDYYRVFIGSTQGIGHVRADSLDFQTTFSEASRNGLNNIKTAINAGAMILIQTTIDSNTDRFFQCVPQSISLTPAQQTEIENCVAETNIQKIWNSGDTKQVCPAIDWILKGSKAIEASGYANYDALKGTFKDIDYAYLRNYRTQVSAIVK